MKTFSLVWLVLFVAAGASAAEVVITSESVAPSVLRTTTGERVNFVNRTGRSVHVEFVGDPREHRLMQVPVAGVAWVVALRPGRHPYAVHFYDAARTELHGSLDATGDTVTTNPEACAVAIMGACLEP
jgi:hypothetical protein